MYKCVNWLKSVILILRLRFQMLKVATYCTFTLHSTICSRKAFEDYNNNDFQFTDSIFNSSVFVLAYASR